MWAGVSPGLFAGGLADVGSPFIDAKGDRDLYTALSAVALGAAVSGTLVSLDTDTLLVSITGGARAAWILADWPLHEPLHWRAMLASRLGPAGASLLSISLYEEGAQGVVAKMRVKREEAQVVLDALTRNYPDLTFAT